MPEKEPTMVSRAAFSRCIAALASGPTLLGAGFAPYRAFIFYRPSGAPLPGLAVQGHVGWGFQDGFGTYVVGSVENTSGGFSVPPAHKDAWISHVLDPLALPGAGDLVGKGSITRYDLYKTFTVDSPNPTAATATAVYEKERTPYNGLHNNCTDYVRKVLRSYGVNFNAQQLRPAAPQAFWKTLPSKELQLNQVWPNSTYDVTLYSQTSRRGLRDQIIGKDANPQHDLECRGSEGTDLSLFRVTNVVVRRGYVAVYDDTDLSGNGVLLSPGSDKSATDVFPSGDILSWFAAPSRFDPKSPPRLQSRERFPTAAARAAHMHSLTATP